ncbi:hypothetical protein AB0L40_16230 [Patulibacter sp. NPDC049589]|uniref:hypothetical protein n=1 Tax=Patulibacter sp. NPDC049589 TaxID=3154731 RepID=UPI00342284ED
MRTAQLAPVTTVDRRGDARADRAGSASADGHALGDGHASVGGPAEPLPDGHPLLPLAAFGLGDVRLVPVLGQPRGVTSVVALIGDPLSSIAPLVRLHRGRPRAAAPGAGIAPARSGAPGARIAPDRSGADVPPTLTDGPQGDGAQRDGARSLGRSGNTGADDLQLVRAFRRLREDGAGILVYHRVDDALSRPHPDDAAPADRALGVPDRSPGLDALAATIASLGLHPVRLLVPASPDPDGLDPRDVGLPVIRSTTFGPGGGPLRPRALVW